MPKYADWGIARLLKNYASASLSYQGYSYRDHMHAGFSPVSA